MSFVDRFDAAVESLSGRLAAGERFDFNCLRFEERQVVFALIDEGRAKLVEVDGRTTVIHRKPNWLILLLTMGARA